MNSVNTSDLGFEQLPHYSTHAQEFFAGLAPKLNMAGVSPTYELFLAGCLRDSVKFLLPDNGHLFADRDYRPAMFELQRLPYPLCALEFRADEQLYAQGSDLVQADKRIALCFDPHKLPPYLAKLLDGLLLGGLGALPERCVAITSVYFGNGVWGAAVGIVVVDLDGDEPIQLSDEAQVLAATGGRGPMTLNIAAQVRGTPSKHALPTTFYTFPERSRLVGLTNDAAYEALYIDTLDEVGVVYEFLAAINCANVDTSDVAAPAKLNAKRARNGRVPFYAYKVLDLAPSSGHDPAHPGAGGGHGSPRTHLRRGHLRRLGERSNNKVLWINASVVNAGKAGGPVSATYKVKTDPAGLGR